MRVYKQGFGISAMVGRLLLILPISFLLSLSVAWSGHIDVEPIEANTSAVQLLLKSRGFDPGPIDGRMGPATRRAISVFQETVGFSATGQLDKQTFEALFETVSAFPVSPVETWLLKTPPGSEKKLIPQSEPTDVSSELVSDTPDAAAHVFSSDLRWLARSVLRFLSPVILVLGLWWLVAKVSKARSRRRDAHHPADKSTSR